MRSEALTVNDYYAALPPERKPAMDKLRALLLKNLPKGFEETMGYGMPGFVVPLKTYPKGYHVTPGTPLGLVFIASQKNFIALYHMALYGDPKLLKWFKDEFPKHSKYKLDMGKSCIRFKNPDAIPFDLIAELARKVSLQAYIEGYEKNLQQLKS